MMSQTNPFELLGMPVTFALDESDLQKRMLAQASEHHPDRFTDPLDQADAAARLAAINQACDQLRQPLTRAQAVLTTLGAPAQQGRDAKLPPDLLLEMMEVRESLEDALSTNDQPQLARLRQWAFQQWDERLADLSQSLETALQNDDDPPRQQAIQAAQTQLNALRYIQRLIDELPPPETPEAPEAPGSSGSFQR